MATVLKHDNTFKAAWRPGTVLSNFLAERLRRIIISCPQEECVAVIPSPVVASTDNVHRHLRRGGVGQHLLPSLTGIWVCAGIIPSSVVGTYLPLVAQEIPFASRYRSMILDSLSLGVTLVCSYPPPVSNHPLFWHSEITYIQLLSAI